MASRRGALGALALLLLAPASCARPSPQREVTLAAAASLRNVLPELIAAHQAEHGGAPKIVATYGSSGDLRRQVEAGAPVDAVLFVADEPVDQLIQKGLVDAATRRVFATNRLVLVGPRGGKPFTFSTIDTALPGDKIAMGDPAHVPAGQYARGVLQKLGEWESVQRRLVFGGDVAAVLAYARRGEVVAAFVYSTDLHGIDDVVLLDEARGDWAPEVRYPAAVTTRGSSPEAARAFLDFLGSERARESLKKHGFGLP